MYDIMLSCFFSRCMDIVSLLVFNYIYTFFRTTNGTLERIHQCLSMYWLYSIEDNVPSENLLVLMLGPGEFLDTKV